MEASAMKARRGFVIQRLMNAMRQVHVVFFFKGFDAHPVLHSFPTRRSSDLGARGARRRGGCARAPAGRARPRSEEHTSELQSRRDLVCRLLLEKKKASTMKSRRAFTIHRLMNAMREAHADGWFIVFATLTLA